jgi:hypothetical protein
MADDELIDAAGNSADTDQLEPSRTHTQLRRRVFVRFSSPKTQEALREAVFSVPGITIFDCERIMEQFANRLNDYLTVTHFKKFRQLAVCWVTRQAVLTVKLRALVPKIMDAVAEVPECRRFAYAATRVLARLPQYEGDVNNDDELLSWAMETAIREVQGEAALTQWMNSHKSAVRAGVWSVLSSCRDLDNCLDDVADELCSETWMFIAANPVDFLDSEVSLHKRFWKKAWYLAHAWKKARLDEIKKGTRPKPWRGTQDFEELVNICAYYKLKGKLPPRPIVLGPGDEDAYDQAKDYGEVVPGDELLAAA